MGVPKFFRWISERYPNISVSIENNEIPIFDCLYLDMNGIIHICSHPDDEDVHFRITEEQIFSNVFKYVDFLFKTVKPKEVFFLAIDGVAPRAKMNQQRGRRFKSTKEAKDRDLAAIKKGVILPVDKRFDSNAITPGTVFMDRLQHALAAFLAEKIQTDQLWHGIDVILSGHETPGEGEHKIQEYIRYKRSLPNYNPNTRHCLYGLDADLMILGLACHEPYFSLLREEVTFTFKNKSRRAYIAEETKFFLLHLSLMREYIDLEFQSLQSILGREYDLERIIDDWIILTFLVGNDFIPHLPNLHIHTSALPLLWKTYIKVRPLMKGYINKNGRLDLGNLMTYLGDLSDFDHRHFEDVFEDMKWMFEKGNKKNTKEFHNSDTEMNLIDFDESVTEKLVKEPLEELTVQSLNLDEDHDADGIWKKQFTDYKTEYYYTKLGLVATPETLAKQARDYLTALQWISYYYFSGVPSWSWFYAQHYAPFVSDLSYLSDNVKENGITFDFGKPFLPFEQLMAVLPSDSSELLPDCFSILMSMVNSPILDFYPKTFQTDLNGKKRDWEAVVLIPFIDEKRLLHSLEAHKELLNKDETRRNVHGPHIKLRFSQKQLTISEIDPAVFRIPRDAMKFGLCENVQMDVICQGFPTFRHVEYTMMREKAFVKVFENHSIFESIVLKITPPTVPRTIETVAHKVLNQMVYVNWPTFILTKIVAVLDKENRITLDPVTKQLITTTLDEQEIRKVKDFLASQPQDSYKRRAILLDLSDVLILESLHSEGSVYEIVSCHKAGCSVRLERKWMTNKTHWYLNQLSILYKSVESVQRNDSMACIKLSQLFPVNALAFCLDRQHYGQCSKIQSINNIKGSIVARLETLKEPDYSDINFDSLGVDYMTVEQISDILQFDSLIISKITGSIFFAMTRSVEPRRAKQKSFRKDQFSIGLDMKNNKFNLQIPGWVKKAKDENGFFKWFYSMKTVQALEDYRRKFPEVFEFIMRPNFESLSLEDLFDVDGDIELLERKYEELRAYLDCMEYRNLERLSNDHMLLCEAQITKLEHVSENLKEYSYTIRTDKPCEVELELSEFYRPHVSLQGSRPDITSEYRLLDRVVCSSDDYTVPIGLRGVVVGIEPLKNDQIRLEILFDKEFSSAISIRGSRARCYRMPPYTLINTSHGLRTYNCPCKVVRPNLPSEFPNNDLLSLFNGFNNHVPRKHDLMIDDLPSSELLAALFFTPSAQLPPMPQSKYSENVTLKKTVNVALAEHRIPSFDSNIKNGSLSIISPQHKVDSPARVFTTVIDSSNCPEQYATLFHMCSQSGISNPSITERHHNNDIFMSFHSDGCHVAETKETDLIQGRLNHASRVWQHLYSMQQQHRHFVAPNYHGKSPTTSPPPPPPAHLVTKIINPDTDMGQSHVKGPLHHRPFIRAPKSKVMFPKDGC